MVYEDELVIAFEDISKTAKKHYLVCPKQHIKDINSLTKLHVPLLERMNKVAEKLLLANAKVQVFDSDEP